jgi:CheY-like chemotaxis protein
MRVIVVEDNTINLAVLCGIVARLPGVECQGFSDPKAAIEDVLCRTSDLVIVDYMMPDIDGLQLVRTLRSLATHAHVPIIMVTANDDRETRLGAVAAGVTDFIAKPVDPIELKARVSNLLQLRGAQNALARRADDLALEVAKATAHLHRREEEVRVLRSALGPPVAQGDLRRAEVGAQLGRGAQVLVAAVGVVERGADEEVMGAEGDSGAEGVACGAVGGGEACELGAGGDGVDVDGTASAVFLGGAGEQEVAVEGDAGAEAGGGSGDFGEECAGGGPEKINALGSGVAEDAGHWSTDGKGIAEEGNGFSELEEDDAAIWSRGFDGAQMGPSGGVEDMDDAAIDGEAVAEGGFEGGVTCDNEGAVGGDGGAEAGVYDRGGFGAEEAFGAGQGLGAERTG